MGWSNTAGAVLQATTVIVSGPGSDVGIFVYSGAPATGNLVGSWTAAGGTDPFGNVFPAGIAIFDSNEFLIGQWNTSGWKLIVDPDGAFVEVVPSPGTLKSPVFSFSGNVAGVSSQNARINSNVNGVAPNQYEGLALIGPTTTADTLASNVNLFLLGALPPANGSATGQFQWIDTGGITAMGQWDNNGFHVFLGELFSMVPGTSDPPTQESWHNLSLNAGFAAAGGASAAPGYQLEGMNGKRVRLRGSVNLTVNQAAGTTLATLPAGYVPAFTQIFAASNTLSGVSGGIGPIGVHNVSGNISLVVAGTAGNTIDLDGVTLELD